MIVSDESVPVLKLAVSEAVIVPAGNQFAAVDQFLFAPPPVHVNVSAHDGVVMTQMAMVAANITGAEKIVVDLIVFDFIVFSLFLSVPFWHPKTLILFKAPAIFAP